MEKFQCENVMLVTKEMYWLAWQASSVVGLGILQDNPSATSDDIWMIVTGGMAVDYSGPSTDNPLRPYGDYVFGRMMKLRLEIIGNEIMYGGMEPRPDYQSWCVKYPTIQSLFDQANKNVHRQYTNH